MADKAVNMALIGAGNRGYGIFGQYALDMPHRAKFTAVVEPDKAKRAFFAKQHGISAKKSFATLKEFIAADLKDIDGVVVATLEDQRLEQVKACMKKNYHMLVEKPLCRTAEELMKFYDATKDYKNIIIVCHQMRLTPIYKTIKNLVDSGKFGETICIQHSENVCYHHMAHSFVRGFFNNSKLTPMLLAKSCHDLDIITYLAGKKIKEISSFGSLKYFKKENAPKGAPEFCLDGCPHHASCPYDVLKIYFNEDTDPAYIRQMGVNIDKNKLLELMKKNRFGKCVFRTDNDVVDHQNVIMNFENDVTVSFTMCGHNGTERRMTKISMTNGEIFYDGTGNTIKTWQFEPLLKEEIEVAVNGTHSGGDRAIMDNFVDAIQTGDRSILLTPIAESFEGHMAVFAAEESRHSGKTVRLADYYKKLRSTK